MLSQKLGNFFFFLLSHAYDLFLFEMQRRSINYLVGFWQNYSVKQLLLLHQLCKSCGADVPCREVSLNTEVLRDL